MIHLGTGVLGENNIGSVANGLGKVLLFMFEEKEALSKRSQMWEEERHKKYGYRRCGRFKAEKSRHTDKHSSVFFLPRGEPFSPLLFPLDRAFRCLF